MNLSDAGLSLIKESEGLRTKVYLDAAGLPTIGYGHKLLNDELYPEGITEEQASQLLTKDVEWAVAGVNAAVHVPLTQGQFDACVDFAYNLGLGRFRQTLGKFINQGRLKDVPALILQFDHAGGKVLPGLQKRRQAEVDLWNS